MTKVNWKPDNGRKDRAIGSYRGCKIDRTTLNSGSHFYYVHWSEFVHYVSPHSKMSDPTRSLQSAKRMIDRLLEREATDPTMIVQRVDKEASKALWSTRGSKPRPRLYIVS